MVSKNDKPAASGVQELIDQIRGQGVRAAKEEGERILAEAKKEAAALRSKAEGEAKAALAAARSQIATEKAAGAEAIRCAARDALLDLRSRVRQAFEEHVRRLVSDQAQDTGFVRSLVLVVAGQAADQFIEDKDAVVFVAGAVAGRADEAPKEQSVREKIAHAVLGASGQMLRQGIDLRADDEITGGVRVKLVGQDLEIDLTDEALSRLLLKHLLPRYRAIVEESATA